MAFTSCPATSTCMLTTSQMTYPVIVSSPFFQRSPRPLLVQFRSTTPHQSPVEPPGRLYTSALAGAVQKYFEQGLAPSTRKTYAAASKRFYNFCSMYHVLSSFPICEYALCCFASHLAEERLAPQTVKAYLSAV